MRQGSQFTAVYINSEIRLGFTLLQLTTRTFRKTNWFPFPPLFPKNRQKYPIKNIYRILRHDWNMNHCPKVWNFPRRFSPLLLQPTLNGGATSTTPSPLTKSIGIFLLVDCEEGKKSLHLQNIHFNHKNTPETSPTNSPCSGMLKRSIQLTPSL